MDYKVSIMDGRRSMIEVLMTAFMAIGFVAASTIALTLLLVALGAIK